MGQPETPEIRYVATPHSLDELCELMATAHQRGLVVVPRGSGSKFGWLDLPPVIDVLLDLSAFSSCRFDPESEKSRSGPGWRWRRCRTSWPGSAGGAPLDPPSTRATVGGTFVTAETGPLSHHFGPPAAHVVDATIALPDGTLSAVADTVKLLGNCVFDLRWAYPGHPNHASVVAEIVLRTQALPDRQTWVTCPVTQPMHISDLLDQISEAGVAPAAIELDIPGLRAGAACRAADRDRGGVGADRGLGGQRARSRRPPAECARLGSHASDQMPQWWGTLSVPAGRGRGAPQRARRRASHDLLHAQRRRGHAGAGARQPRRRAGWAALPGDLPRAAAGDDARDGARGVVRSRRFSCRSGRAKRAEGGSDPV